MRSIVYATRRSTLALAQSRAFAARLSPHLSGEGLAIETTELQITTSGDRIQDRPLADVGGKGLFVKEIEEALLDGRADFAVHSIKDVPATLPPGLILACIPAREDPRDALVAPRFRTLDALPRGGRLGTSSLRRMVAIRAHRPDLDVVPLRGNVDTRLQKVEAGAYDAIVLARAGLVRLGLEGRATQILAVDVSVPAPGQGALGIECREADAEIVRLLARLHDAEAGTCIAAERGVLEAVGGDCRTPLGAYAERTTDRMRIRAFRAEIDGTRVRHTQQAIAWPATEAQARAVGLELGRRLD